MRAQIAAIDQFKRDLADAARLAGENGKPTLYIGKSGAVLVDPATGRVERNSLRFKAAKRIEREV